MSKAAEYLRKQEWSMGNGQCPECHGASDRWLGHPLHSTADTIGHEVNCSLAASLREIGEIPVMKPMNSEERNALCRRIMKCQRLNEALNEAAYRIVIKKNRTRTL